MHIKKLEISGFKSFVERTSIHFDHDVIGIVGPNGCGKSNLVEALRWVMGETSAKRMRGSEMDDVIFGGNSNRPPRNVAEVTLAIDNTARKVPAQFNDFDFRALKPAGAAIVDNKTRQRAGNGNGRGGKHRGRKQAGNQVTVAWAAFFNRHG